MRTRLAGRNARQEKEAMLHDVIKNLLSDKQAGQSGIESAALSKDLEMALKRLRK